MTPLARNLLRGIALLLLILAVWGAYGALTTFDQGEAATPLGMVVIWATWAALLMALVAIVLALFKPQTSARFAGTGLIAALPLAFVTVYPRSWCWAMPCSDAATIPALVPQGLLILLLFGLPVWLLRKV